MRMPVLSYFLVMGTVLGVLLWIVGSEVQPAVPEIQTLAQSVLAAPRKLLCREASVSAVLVSMAPVALTRPAMRGIAVPSAWVRRGNERAWWQKHGIEPLVVRHPGIAMDIDNPVDLVTFMKMSSPVHTRTLAFLEQSGVADRLLASPDLQR